MLIRCLPGSVRIRTIESARAVLLAPRLSDPSTSVTCGLRRMLPAGVSALSGLGARRGLALAISVEKGGEAGDSQNTSSRAMAATPSRVPRLPPGGERRRGGAG